MRKLLAGGLMAAALFATSGCSPEQEAKGEPRKPDVATSSALPIGAGFDFYVLSLSWSPSYCEAEGKDANRQQCEGGRPYAFVVHGLWPQFERGYPENCGTAERDVDQAMLRGLYDIMPSAGLIRHQWRKHGSCSGLEQDDYFRVLRQARRRVAIPQEYGRVDRHLTVSPASAEAAFLKANPGMPREGLAVTCDRRYLREVRICMTKDLHYRPCPDVDARACRAAQVIMPPMRG
ncbi:ribonuclease [Corticibacterium sp. UT-5YL-CI-8]|nr:ribonuclease [Tianweitania sp. UT-5YL-CI-8]